MTGYVDKNKQLLRRYYKVLMVLGWILLWMGIISFIMVLSEAYQTGGSVKLDTAWGSFKRFYPAYMRMGLLSLGLAQLVRYFCENKIGLLLRYGDKIFYLWAVMVIWSIVVLVWTFFTGKLGGNLSFTQWLIEFTPTLLYNIAKVLLLIGFGKLLKQYIASIDKINIVSN